MAQTLSGKTVAILATDGVELVELTEPMKALNEAGASVEIVSLKAGDFQGFNHLTPGDKVTADKAVAGVDASAYSALMLPGGVANPDQLRANEDAVKFVRAFFDAEVADGGKDEPQWHGAAQQGNGENLEPHARKSGQAGDDLRHHRQPARQRDHPTANPLKQPFAMVECLMAVQPQRERTSKLSA